MCVIALFCEMGFGSDDVTLAYIILAHARNQEKIRSIQRKSTDLIGSKE